MSRRAGTLLAAFVVPALIGTVVARRVSDGRPRKPAEAPLAAPADPISTLEIRASSYPDDARAWQQLAVAYSREASRTQDAAFVGLAAKALGKSQTLAPTAPETQIAAGMVALGSHHFHEAETAAASALAARPEDRSALAIAVDAAVELGRYDDAARIVQRLADLRPDATALARISYLRELHGDLSGALDAMKQAEQAASATPAEAKVLATLVGDLSLQTGDVDAAETAYRRGNSAVGLARSEFARGRVDAAITALRPLGTPAAGRLLGSLTNGEGFDVVRASDRLLEAAGVRLELESALFEADHGTAERAVQLARAAHDDRTTIFTADALAWSLHRAGRDAEAVPFVTEALRTNSRSVSLRLHAAIILQSGDQLRVAFEGYPWFAPELRADAAVLATRLGVALPEAWRT